MLIKDFRPFNHKTVESAPMLKNAGNYFGAMVRSFRFWIKPAPIDNFVALADFCFAQSAHIAQTTLYGYLRTRAGLQHFNLFTDETFVAMLRPARSRLMLVCVEDLALYCVAVIGERTGLSPAAMQALGIRLWPTPLTSLPKPTCRKASWRPMHMILQHASSWWTGRRGRSPTRLRAFTASPD